MNLNETDRQIGICPQGGRPSRAQDRCSRFCPDPLGIVLWFDKLDFAELFWQRSAVPMRYASLPPAFMRGGGTSPQTGTGGSTNFGPHNIKLNHFSVFFCSVFDVFMICVGRTPPAPVCALGHPPHKCGGRGRLRRQPCKFQFVASKNDTERVRAGTITDQACHGLPAGHPPIPSGSGKKRLHKSTARLSRPPCGPGGETRKNRKR